MQHEATPSLAEVLWWGLGSTAIEGSRSKQADVMRTNSDLVRPEVRWECDVGRASDDFRTRIESLRAVRFDKAEVVVGGF